MPLKFRCQHCRQKLSVSSKKAGQRVKCPACKEPITIPVPEEPEEEAPLVLTPEPTSPKSTSKQPPKAEAPAVPSPDRTATAASAPVDGGMPQAGTDLKDDGPEHVVIDEEGEPFAVRGAKTELDEMDLTPMVDVTFLLLIFFMITASFSTQKTIDIPAPDPDKQGAAQTIQNMQELEEYAIMIAIDGDDRIFVDEVPVELAELEDTFRRKGFEEEKNELVIEVDSKATHKTLVKVIDAGNGAEMQKIRLATRKSE